MSEEAAPGADTPGDVAVRPAGRRGYDVTFAPRPRAVLTIVLTVVAVVLVLYLIYLLRKPIGWLAVASFLAVALSGPVGYFSRWMSRGKAMALSYVGLFLVPLLLLAIVVPPLASRGATFVQKLPQYAQDLQDSVQKNKRLRKLDEKYHFTQKLQQKAAELPGRAGTAAKFLGNLGIGLVNSLFALVTIIILSAFMLAGGRDWIESLLRRWPDERADRMRDTLNRMSGAVVGYCAGALLQATVAGVSTFVVLLILGVPFAAPLAVITALFDLIPMVGATIAAVFVGIITAFTGFPLITIIWTVWAIVYQQIENNVIQPRIQSRAVGVHPFVVVVAVLFGGTLLGVPGAVLAVPVAATIQVFLRDWSTWSKDIHEAEAGPAPEPDPA
jgi:predicted PurR-regulated permease PerM